MRERLRTALVTLRSIERPELTPVTWTIALFMGTILGDGVRARASRTSLTGTEANLIALLVILGFVALVVVVATVVQAVRDR